MGQVAGAGACRAPVNFAVVSFDVGSFADATRTA